MADDPNYSSWTRVCPDRNLVGVTREIATLKKRIGTRIRERRGERRMSQEALAYEAQLSTYYLSRIESGKCNPTLEMLCRICTALRLNLADLVNGESRPASP